MCRLGGGDMNRYVESIQRALKLAREGNAEAGIRDLESAFDDAIAADDTRGVSLIALNAGMLRERQGDLVLALKFYERGLEIVGDEPYLLLAAGNVSARIGDVNKKAKYYARCRKRVQQDPDFLQLLAEAEEWSK